MRLSLVWALLLFGLIGLVSSAQYERDIPGIVGGQRLPGIRDLIEKLQGYLEAQLDTVNGLTQEQRDQMIHEFLEGLDSFANDNDVTFLRPSQIPGYIKKVKEYAEKHAHELYAKAKELAKQNTAERRSVRLPGMADLLDHLREQLDKVLTAVTGLTGEQRKELYDEFRAKLKEFPEVNGWETLTPSKIPQYLKEIKEYARDVIKYLKEKALKYVEQNKSERKEERATTTKLPGSVQRKIDNMVEDFRKELERIEGLSESQINRYINEYKAEINNFPLPPLKGLAFLNPLNWIRWAGDVASYGLKISRNILDKAANFVEGNIGSGGKGEGDINLPDFIENKFESMKETFRNALKDYGLTEEQKDALIREYEKKLGDFPLPPLKGLDFLNPLKWLGWSKDIAKYATEHSKNLLEQAEEWAKDITDEVKDKIKEAAEKAYEIAAKAREAAEQALEKAKDFVELAEKDARETLEKAKEAAKLAEEMAKEAVEKATEKAKEIAEKAQEVAEEAKKAAEQAKKKAEEAAIKAEEKAKELAEKAKEALEKAKEVGGDLAKEALKKAQELAEKAKEAAEQALQKATEVAEAAKETAEMAVEKAKEAAKMAEKKAEEALEKATDEAKELAEKANEIAEKAKAAAEEAKKMAKEAAKKVEEKAEELAEKALEAVKKAKEAGEDVAKEVLDKAKEAAKMVAEKAKEAAEKAEKEVEFALEVAKEAARIAEEKAEEAIKEASEIAKELAAKAKAEAEIAKEAVEQAKKKATEAAKKAEEKAKELAEILKETAKESIDKGKEKLSNLPAYIQEKLEQMKKGFYRELEHITGLSENDKKEIIKEYETAINSFPLPPLKGLEFFNPLKWVQWGADVVAYDLKLKRNLLEKAGNLIGGISACGKRSQTLPKVDEDHEEQRKRSSKLPDFMQKKLDKMAEDFSKQLERVEGLTESQKRQLQKEYETEINSFPLPPLRGLEFFNPFKWVRWGADVATYGLRLSNNILNKAAKLVEETIGSGGKDIEVDTSKLPDFMQKKLDKLVESFRETLEDLGLPKEQQDELVQEFKDMLDTYPLPPLKGSDFLNPLKWLDWAKEVSQHALENTEELLKKANEWAEEAIANA